MLLLLRLLLRVLRNRIDLFLVFHFRTKFPSTSLSALQSINHPKFPRSNGIEGLLRTEVLRDLRFYKRSFGNFSLLRSRDLEVIGAFPQILSSDTTKDFTTLLKMIYISPRVHCSAHMPLGPGGIGLPFRFRSWLHTQFGGRWYLSARIISLPGGTGILVPECAPPVGQVATAEFFHLFGRR